MERWTKLETKVITAFNKKIDIWAAIVLIPAALAAAGCAGSNASADAGPPDVEAACSVFSAWAGGNTGEVPKRRASPRPWVPSGSVLTLVLRCVSIQPVMLDRPVGILQQFCDDFRRRFPEGIPKRVNRALQVN